jgi:hypothetical protein
MIDQMTIGHRFLEQEFGCASPLCTLNFLSTPRALFFAAIAPSLVHHITFGTIFFGARRHWARFCSVHRHRPVQAQHHRSITSLVLCRGEGEGGACLLVCLFV